MAERSTAAVDVARTRGEGKKPHTAEADADRATTDGARAQQNDGESPDEGGTAARASASVDPGDVARPPELHSGHRLARRYRLEECVTRLDGFSSWRAVDEKLRRAVGMHVLPAAHPRARRVLGAARSAALLGDPRFVQVLDAVEEGELVYVVHEWLPDATSLSTLLLAGPLEAYEAYQLVSQLSQAMAAAHREGLAHLRLTPGAVLRTETGQYRIRGLAVSAALRGICADQPQRTDTEAIGALLYAGLTQRWPYDEDAYGLSGVPGLAKGALVPPDQVRAGVHRGLSELAMRALVNDGATASSEEPPCTTPESLAKAVAAMPRIRPSEPAYPAPGPYRNTTYQQGAYSPAGGPKALTEPPAAPPTLPGRTGHALKWSVSALLIAALGLGSWQLADVLMRGESPARKTSPSHSAQDTAQGEPRTGEPLRIAGAQDFDPPPGDGTENPGGTAAVHDDDPDTDWATQHYYGRPDLGGLKDGVGVILDLGASRQVGSVEVSLVGDTAAELLAAAEDADTAPSSLGEFSMVADGKGAELTLRPEQPVSTRYLLVWLTELPKSGDGYRGRISEVKVIG